MAGTGRASTFRPDIEGLRAVAVLLVLAGHVLGVPAGGYVGVDVFFVVSGFLITGLLLREHDEHGRISLREFYARRARRLLPAAVLVLVVTNLAAWLLFAAERASQTLQDSLWALGFLANVRFAAVGTDYFDLTRPDSPVQHYWSLAVEEQFYLAWPLLLLGALLVARRAGPAVVLALATAGSLAWSIHLTAAAPTAAYFSTATRAWELGLGALLAVGARAGLVQSLPRRVSVGLGWLGLAGVVLSAFLVDATTPFPGVAAVVPAASAALVLQAGEAGAADRNALLTHPVSRWIGRVSYSLYLWHWPVLVLATAVLPAALVVAVALPLSFGLAALSHRFVEQPVRHSTWLSRRPERRLVVHRPAVAFAAAAALLGFALPALALQGDPTPPVAVAAPVEADPVALTAEIEASLAPASWPVLQPSLDGIRHAGAPEWLVDKCDNVNPGNVDSCRYGPPDAPRRAALVGDSMAISWLPALRTVLEPQGFEISVLTRNQCPVPALLFFRQTPVDPYEECAEHRSWAVEQVRALAPDLVVVSNALTMVEHQVAQPEGDERYRLWREGMRQTLAELDAAAGEVVLLGAPPRAGNVQECVTRLSEPVDCTEPVPAQWRAVRAAEQAAALEAGTTYVDPERWFCVAGRCPAVVGSTPVYTDGRHLTAAYARRLSPHLAQVLAPTTRS